MIKKVLNSKQIKLAVILVAVTGVYLTLASHALSVPATFEAETGAVSGAATKGSDTTASNGQYVQFGNVPTSGGGSTGIVAGNMYTDVPMPTNADISLGTFIGTFASCDFAANGLGQDVPVTFTSGGNSYQGCYSVKKGGAAGTHPVLFPFHGNFLLDSTTADYNQDNSQYQNPITEALGDQWDIIVPAAMRLVSSTNHSQITGHALSGNQITVDYFKAILADAKARQGMAAGRAYFSGFSGGSQIPVLAACYLGSDVSAVVTESGMAHGPASGTSSLGHVSCVKPARPVSVMFSEATDDSDTKPNSWLGWPNYNYSAHITPTHTSLTSADITAITSYVPGTDWTNVVHGAEVWAYWHGCGNNLAGYNSQSITVYGNPATFWDWTGCATAASGRTSEVQLYVINGRNLSFNATTGNNHGVERSVIADPTKPAWNFLKNH